MIKLFFITLEFVYIIKEIKLIVVLVLFKMISKVLMKSRLQNLKNRLLFACKNDNKRLFQIDELFWHSGFFAPIRIKQMIPTIIKPKPPMIPTGSGPIKGLGFPW